MQILMLGFKELFPLQYAYNEQIFAHISEILSRSLRHVILISLTYKSYKEEK